MPRASVHFDGSVNLPDAEAVMREISSRIPVGVRRMTDGETGDRGYWILFQIRKFLQMPGFEAVTAGQACETSADAPQMPGLRLAEGASADTIEWPDLGYAGAYAGSFGVFDRLQQQGTIRAGVRFQVQYPTPLASMAGTIVPGDQQAVAASYERPHAARKCPRCTPRHRPVPDIRTCRGQGRALRAQQGLWPRHVVSREP